jgi:hypothetical protein
VGRDTHQVEKGVRIIARSLFRALMASGYQPAHAILLSAELIELVTESLRRLGDEPIQSH